MKKLVLLTILLIVGCATKTFEPTATFCIGMTEEEFIRNNPNITENNLDWQLWEKVVNNSPETIKYIETLKKMNTYIAYKADEDGEKTHGWAIPYLPQKHIFVFNYDTLKAVFYKKAFSPNKEIDYSIYSTCP